jgi:hypothetical protein
METGTQIQLRWLSAHDPTNGKVEIRSLLNRGLADSNRPVPRPQWPDTRLKSILWSEMRQDTSKGKFMRGFDTALQGKHTRVLYDGLNRHEASLLA